MVDSDPYIVQYFRTPTAILVLILLENHTQKKQKNFVKSNVFKKYFSAIFLYFSYSDLFVILELKLKYMHYVAST